jgi:hypothetical protein
MMFPSASSAYSRFKRTALRYPQRAKPALQTVEISGFVVFQN